MIAKQRLYLVAPTPQVETTWTNFDNTSSIYFTQDTGVNIVSLVLTNQLGDTVTLPPGTPAPFGSLPTGQSAIYIFFQGMLTNAEVQAIAVTAQSSIVWSVANFLDADKFAYLVLSPKAQVQLENNRGLEFQLTHILSSASDFSAPVYVQIAGAAGLDPAYANTQVYVNVQTQPVAGNKDLHVNTGFASGDLVFTGGQANELVLYLTNPDPTPLVPGGASTWGPTPPTFQLSFVFGSGAGALASEADAVGMNVNLGQTFGNVWKPVAKQSQGESPVWIMQPDPNGGGDVLGTGQNGTISFDITNIVTELPQGLTYAYLSYANIPGYNSGYYALEILKVDPVKISSFTATPASITGATGPTQVSLQFEVLNASYVTITNAGYAQPTTSHDFAASVDVTSYASTTYTLIASNFATGQVLSFPLQVSVATPDLLATAFGTASAAVSGTLTAAETIVNTMRMNGPADGSTMLSLSSNGALAVDASYVPGGRFVVQNNGNVGINQPNPAATLDVNGAINIAAYSAFQAGASINGPVRMCDAPDGSKGIASVGGMPYPNIMLNVNNSVSTTNGLAVFSTASTSPYWALWVEGGVNTSGSISRLADATLQENIRSCEDGLASVLQLNPIHYRFKAETGLGGEDHLGVSAQDLQKIAPYAVSSVLARPDSKEERLTIQEGALIYMLINSVKELSSRVETLEAHMATLHEDTERQ